MLLTNAAPYTKNYRVLAVGKAKLLISKDVLIVNIANNAWVVYRNGNLKGVVLHSVGIFTRSHAYSSLHTNWSIDAICGLSRNNHNIPYYYDNDSLSVYGFKVTQYKAHYGVYHKLNTSTNDKLRYQI